MPSHPFHRTSRLAAASVLLSAAAALGQDAGAGGGDILVIGDRSIIESLRGVAAEREFGEREVGEYGASTVGEFVDEVRGELGDDEVIFLVDGEPVTGIDDVADFPAEAVERIEVLPAGSGQRIGREPNRRVYNVVLKNQLRSATLDTGYELASEGEWSETKAEAILSRIAGRERMNLTLRVRDSDALTEADRGIVQPAPSLITRPADYYETVDGGAFRTLRGSARNYEASLIGGSPLGAGLSTSYSFVGRIGRDRSLAGLPYSLFSLPGSSTYSPTGTDQTLVLFGPDSLANRSERKVFNGNTTVNATRGSWIGALTGQFTLADRSYDNARPNLASLSQPITVPAGRNPFTDPLDDLFSTGLFTSRSKDRFWLVRLNVGGPVVALPAGSLRMRSAVQRDFDRSRTISGTGAGSDVRRYSRAATRFDGGIDIPLASRRQGFLAALGELTLSLDGGYHAVDNLPNLDRSAISTLWQPTERLSLSGSITKTEELPLIELLTDPVVIYDNVRILDFLSGETVDVRAVTGGNPGLSPLSKTARRASVSAALWQKYNLQLNLDYESTTVRNHVGAVPASSSAVFLAFPERFQRDADGRLVLIDTRAVNFDRQRREDLRYGVSFTLPVGRPSAAEPGTGAPAGRSRTRLQVNASHTYALQNDIVYRPGLPVVDLLRGGAVGFGVTQPRHFVNGSVALSGPGYGLRLNGAFRSASTLQSGSLAAPEELRFASLLTANLRTFVELDSIWPTSMVLKQTRVSLGIDNLANRRQRVTDASGTVPLRFQPAYRDAVGRTLQIELRKVL
jgi:hypothetical protein